MRIPAELKAPIDEIKTASNRVLVIGMALCILSLASAVVYQTIKLTTQGERLSQQRVDALLQSIHDKDIKIREKDSLIWQLNDRLISFYEKREIAIKYTDSIKQLSEKVKRK